MTALKSLTLLAAASVALLGSLRAEEIIACPDDYQAQAAAYMESRLTDARGARVQVSSKPYRVEADLNGRSELEGWGVDVRVRSRLPTGAYGGYVAYTVIFVDGRPVATNEDASDIERI